MSLFVIGDLHLSLDGKKSMEIFPGWENYIQRIEENWRETVLPSDTVVLAGDTSWAMSLEQTEADFAFLDALPGKKILLKGNHDYWWSTKTKMENFFVRKGFSTLHILHNNHYAYGEHAVCGTRGWINESTEPADAKVLVREAARLEISIQSAKRAGLKPIAFLHYPPVFASDSNYEILEVLFRHGVSQCYYGHIHGKGAGYAINGERDGIHYKLISCDYIQYLPQKVF